jgi:hypothetical protein
MIKKWFYPRRLDINYFRNAKILNTDTPLYKDYEKVYEDYLIRYEQFCRDEKITKIIMKDILLSYLYKN